MKARKRLSSVKSGADNMAHKITTINADQTTISNALIGYGQRCYAEGYKDAISDLKKMREYRNSCIEESFKNELQNIHYTIEKNKRQ
jgi:hypothetical protein